MSRKLDFRKDALASKRKLSVVDEQEYRESDAAARWLERQAKAPVKPHNSSKGKGAKR